MLEPVHSCGISMQGGVPVHRQKLHTTYNMLIQSLLKMTLQQLQGYTAEVIHCEPLGTHTHK